MSENDRDEAQQAVEALNQKLESMSDADLRDFLVESMLRAAKAQDRVKAAIRNVEAIKAHFEMDRRGIDLTDEQIDRFGSDYAKALPGLIDSLIVDDIRSGELDLADATWEASRDLPELVDRIVKDDPDEAEPN
jgi:hypothetical protein